MHFSAINHIALHVADVERSVAFYQDTLELTPLPRPDFDFPGAWFRIGTSQELHLLGDRTLPVHSHARGAHFALQIPNSQAAAQELTRKGVAFSGPKQRPDGIWQLFVQDPDGYYIELCEVK